MSRGLGWVQREILKVLDDGRLRTIRDLTIDVYEHPMVVLRIPPSRKQEVAVRRAVHSLAAQGLVRVIETSMQGFKDENGQIMGKMLVRRARRVSVASHDCNTTPAEITAMLDRLLELARSQTEVPIEGGTRPSKE